MKEITKKEEFSILRGKYIPKSAIQRLGCLFCEWRDRKACPNLKKGKTKVPENGICDKRIDWITSLTADYKTPPTFSQWRLDYNNAVMEIRVRKEKQLEEELELEYQKKVSEGFSETELKTLRTKIEKHKNFWSGFWKELQRLDDLQVNRETPRKRELDVRVEHKATPADVAALIRKANEKEKIVDVEVNG